MRKIAFSLLFFFLSFGPLVAHEKHAYKQELTALQQSPQFQAVVNNEEAPAEQQENALELEVIKFSIFERLMYKCSKALVLSQKSLPKLYSFIENICTEHNIAMPIIYISLSGGEEAAATQSLTGINIVVISSSLIDTICDNELEAVVCHEIGHLKHNHIHKTRALYSAAFAGSIFLEYFLEPTTTNQILHWSVLLLPKIIINKRFEKQADEFAYKDVGKADGLLKLFEHRNAKSNEFEDLIEKNIAEEEPTIFEKQGILGYTFYKIGKMRYRLEQLHRWICHNTPWGDHPNHEERIKTIKEYRDGRCAKS